MPYKIEADTIEKAKYRAKMAVRNAKNPTAQHLHRTTLRWASIAVAAVVVAAGVFGLVKYQDELFGPKISMDELFAEMDTAPDYILREWARDVYYYPEEKN